MPEAWTYWDCCTCHKRHSHFDAADACERSHIVDTATEGFASDLKAIMKKGRRDAAR